MALSGVRLKVGEVKNVNDAMSYLMDSHLANVELLADKAQIVKWEFERAIELGQASLTWAKEFGINLENTRAEKISNEFNSNVKAWANDLLSNRRPRGRSGAPKH